jgi:hypothetical protein
MIIDQTKLKVAVMQAIEEINDACYDLRQEGVGVLLPEFIDFEVQLVTDINAVSRSSSKDNHNAGESTSTTTIDHPTVFTGQSGVDNSDETVTITYKQ